MFLFTMSQVKLDEFLPDSFDHLNKLYKSFYKTLSLKKEKKENILL